MLNNPESALEVTIQRSNPSSGLGGAMPLSDRLTLKLLFEFTNWLEGVIPKVVPEAPVWANAEEATTTRATVRRRGFFIELSKFCLGVCGFYQFSGFLSRVFLPC